MSLYESMGSQMIKNLCGLFVKFLNVQDLPFPPPPPQKLGIKGTERSVRRIVVECCNDQENIASDVQLPLLLHGSLEYNQLHSFEEKQEISALFFVPLIFARHPQ